MSIESAIENAQQKVANAYTAVSNKGGTLPATQNLSNLPTAINTISTAGTVETLNVTPSTSAQQFVPSGGVDGYNPVNVSAVTSSIDANISAGNIKDGVTILGVTGNVTELNGETRTVSLTSSSSSGQTFTPSSGKNGITSITVKANNQARTVTPSTSSQSLTVNSGYSGNGTITVNAVTSSIDSDIIASNIKQGVNILGVNGSVVELKGETKTVTPTTSQQTITPSSGKNGITEVTVNAVTSSIDNNITAGNIKKNVTILGVTGTYEGSGGGGGSSNFDLPSNMKIIKATSMTISYNNTDIDIENLETGGDVLPFLIFCCPEDDVENATDGSYELTGGFFLSFCGQSYGLNQQYSIGMNEGLRRNTWYGKVFGVYTAGLSSLADGDGSIECMEGGTSTIRLMVTWDVPE